MKTFRRVVLSAVLADLAFVSVAAPFDDGGAMGMDCWGGRKAHLAVVNAVCGSDPAWTISLSGEWEFTTLRGYDPRRNMYWGGWMQDRADWGSGRIRVPGCWEGQGIGSEGHSIGYSLGDHLERTLRHFFSGEG